MYNSLSFLVAHTFFKPCVAKKFITAPMLRAPVGHTDTHLCIEHLARGERLVVLDELQYVEWHIVVASPRHIRKRVVDDDRHDVNVFFEDL